MFRRALGAVALAVALVFTPIVGVVTAGAQEIPNDAPSVAPEASLTLTAWSIYVIVSFFLPLLVSLATRLNASPTVKLIVNAFVATIAGLITTGTQSDGTALISLTSFKYAAVAFAISAGGYLIAWQPINLNAKSIVFPNRGLHFGTAPA